MKIAVGGMGYVGLSLAVLLAQKNEVAAVDIVKEKVDLINSKQSPLKDDYIEKYLAEKELRLRATLDAENAYRFAEAVIIAAPTDYDDKIGVFNTSVVENIIKTVVNCNSDVFIVVKSTVPIGFTEKMRQKYGTEKILFSPEFLREGKALYDNLYPSRIIVGGNKSALDFAHRFAEMLTECALKDDIPTLFTGSSEAEAVKLFSNAYLAMRIAYFNELDTYAESRGLNSKEIINGVCLEPRVGDYYNNPSFGYGGYCLPKDTKQLRADYSDTPQSIFSAIVEANEKRKDFIANSIIKKLSKTKNTVGIYRLTMKSGSDNFREAAIIGVMNRLREKSVKILVYEPTSERAGELFGAETVNDFELFKKRSDVILANRYDKSLDDVSEKVYTRDIFGRD